MRSFSAFSLANFSLSMRSFSAFSLASLSLSIRSFSAFSLANFSLSIRSFSAFSLASFSVSTLGIVIVFVAKELKSYLRIIRLVPAPGNIDSITGTNT